MKAFETLEIVKNSNSNFWNFPLLQQALDLYDEQRTDLTLLEIINYLDSKLRKQYPTQRSEGEGD